MTRTGSLGAELTESQAALRVFLSAGGLVLVGLVLLLLTVWWWRGTKPEPPALGPLEVMSDRKWSTTAESERRRLLEAHRPEGSTVSNGYVPVPVDLSVLAREAPSSFDDLRDPVEAPMVATVDPEAAEISGAAVSEAGEDVETPSDVDDAQHDDVDGSDAEADTAADGSDDARADEPDAAESVEAAGDDADVDETVGSSSESSDGSVEIAEGHAADPGDATVAMSRDETTAMSSPDQPYAPNAGA